MMNGCTQRGREAYFTNPDSASYVGAPFVMPISLSVRSGRSQRARHSTESRPGGSKADCRRGGFPRPKHKGANKAGAGEGTDIENWGEAPMLSAPGIFGGLTPKPEALA